MKTLNIKTFSDKLYASLENQLEETTNKNTEVANCVCRSLTIIRSIISQLREFIHQYQFSDLAEEILFFKEIKPTFVSQYHYQKELFDLNVRGSYLSISHRRKIYTRALERIESFTRKNQEFYEYYLAGSTHFDAQYFTRRCEALKFVDKDIKFCTTHDAKVARILAGDRLRSFLLEALRRLDSKSHVPPALTWTASKTDLTELIYALHTADVFNKGSADIKLIAETFETIFNVSLGDYYRTFQSIQIRKKSNTNFLDSLKSSLTTKMNGGE